MDLLDANDVAQQIVDARCSKYFNFLEKKEEDSSQAIRDALVSGVEAQIDKLNSYFDSINTEIQALTSSIEDMVEIVVNTSTAVAAMAVVGVAGTPLITAATSQVSAVKNAVKGIACSGSSLCEQMLSILTPLSQGLSSTAVGAILESASTSIGTLQTSLSVFM